VGDGLAQYNVLETHYKRQNRKNIPASGNKCLCNFKQHIHLHNPDKPEKCLK